MPGRDPNPNMSSKVVGLDTTNFPVGGVNWNDAAEFCAKLSELENLVPLYSRRRRDGRAAGRDRIPTAHRGRVGIRLPCRDDHEVLERRSGRRPDGSRVVRQRTPAVACTNVGELKSNPFGLFDVHGNAFEWVDDWWEPTYYGQFVEKPAINPCCLFSSTSQRRDPRW